MNIDHNLLEFSIICISYFVYEFILTEYWNCLILTIKDC